MKLIRLAFVIATPLAFASFGLWACSSSGGSSSGDTSGEGGKGGNTPPPGSGDDGGGGGPGDDGGDVPPGVDGGDCGTPPKLFPPKPTATTFYCPFGTSADGGHLYCSRSDTCCETVKGGPPSTCSSGKITCPTGDTTWQCESAADCASGEKCCAHGGADGGAVTIQDNVACGTKYLSHFGGTKCAASCAAGELTVCEQTTDCTGVASGTCQAVKPKGNDIGVCN